VNLPWLFGGTMFVAAFLLFSVQPMIAKTVLPLLGGTPGVWNTCMVFYQSALLAGYAYAHWGARRLGISAQAAIHGVLFLLAVAFLPIANPLNVPPQGSGGIAPALWLFKLLVATAGLPLLVVSATAPLLQHWFSRGGHRDAQDPYFLYAASNAGSLAGLLCYPFVIEPTIPLVRQGRLWWLGFLAMAALVAACGVTAARFGSRRDDLGSTARAEDDGPDPRPRDLAWWGLLALVPSSWMLGVTTYLTTDLAAIPLFWTIPLGLYLLSFILAFSRGFGSWARPVSAAFFLLAVHLVLVLAAGFVQLFWMPLHLLVFFLGALACHGRLAAARPAARHLTAYFLAVATGGALGGAFNALVVPMIFDRLAEYPLALLLGCMLAPAVAAPRRQPGTWERRLDVLVPALVFVMAAILVTHPREAMDTDPGIAGTILASGVGMYACVTGLWRPARFALAAAAVLLASGLAPGPGGRVLYRSRDFFGVLRVLHDQEADVHRLMHGSTLHGQQSLDPSRKHEPSTYFARSGPIGGVFEALAARRTSESGRRIAIVGLGAGTLACYAEPSQSWTFYEIDPAVPRVAEDPRYFTYLADARARDVSVKVVLGDARIRLREESEPRYALIVLDAFSSDAVPVHLLTREAVALYRQRLAPGGLLAFNLSNRYLDLDPVLGRQASDAGLVCRIRSDFFVSEVEKAGGKQPSIWAVLAAREEDLGPLAADPRWQSPQVRTGTRVWTDDDSDLAARLILGGRRFPAAPPSRPLAEERATP
jgi:hypothetical protein